MACAALAACAQQPRACRGRRIGARRRAAAARGGGQARAEPPAAAQRRAVRGSAVQDDAGGGRGAARAAARRGAGVSRARARDARSARSRSAPPRWRGTRASAPRRWRRRASGCRPTPGRRRRARSSRRCWSTRRGSPTRSRTSRSGSPPTAENVGQNFLQLSPLLARHKDKADGTQADAGAGEAVSRSARGAAGGGAGGMERGRAAGGARRGARGAEAAARLGAWRRCSSRRCCSAAPTRRRCVSSASIFRSYPAGARRAAQLRAAAGQRQELSRGAQAVRGCWSPSTRRTPTSAWRSRCSRCRRATTTRRKPSCSACWSWTTRIPTWRATTSGRSNEERKRFDEALKWYSTVAQGEQYINAQARYAGILAKQGKLPEARQHLQQAGANRQPAARAADAGRGAVAARCQRIPGGVRSAGPGARENAQHARTCSTTTRWRRRRSTASTCSRATSSS